MNSSSDYFHSPVLAFATLVLRFVEHFASSPDSRLLQPVLGPFTGSQLLATALCVAFAACFHFLIFHLFRWWRLRQHASEQPDSWPSLALHTVAPPIYLTLWFYGLYFAVAPLLLSLPPTVDHPSLRLFNHLFALGLFVAFFWLAFRTTHAVEIRLRLWAKSTSDHLDRLIIPLLGRTLRTLMPIVAIILTLPLLGLPEAYAGLIARTSSLLIIAAIAWILFQIVILGEQFIISRYNITVADNLRARQVHTQVLVLKKTLLFVIVVFSFASVLMLFDQVRQLGTSILASAGVVGIIVGFAAQRTIANLLAGLQIALTQPIRIDDVVIVEDEWGRIEEITLTYVVVRIWDLRRLILPINYFIERPFQNWTRVSADILGSVFLHADYSIPIDPLRAELQRILHQSPLWDRKVCVLQVTNATDKTIEIRALASAADASAAWDLRCEIREKLITFIQHHYPESLPKVRATFDPPPPTAPKADPQPSPPSPG
jgi:small-conductance mechanosensitive channel